MFCLFLGRTGSGKSYEMTKYHVLDAVENGRMVVTNLPLNMEMIISVYPNARELIILKHPTKENPKPFSHVQDYIYEWRHPETNQGPLIIIDEAHKYLPRGKTPTTLLEWLAESRHAGVDIYFATQGTRKIDANVMDLVDITYRLVKRRASGNDGDYIRKVIDGYRGEVFNTDIRTYDPAYFKFYQSHTKSNKAILESVANDIRPWWKHWYWYGTALCFIFSIYTISTGMLNPLRAANASTESKPKPKLQIKQSQEPGRVEVASLQATETSQDGNEVDKVKALPADIPPPALHPYHKMALHVSGSLDRESSYLGLFSASQNGQPIFYLTSTELITAGYTIKYISECSVLLEYEELNYSEYLTCNMPSVSIG